MTTGTIFKIKKYALHDGPGIRTTVFFKGCPLACPWCHNPEGIDPACQPMERHTSTGCLTEMVGSVATADELLKSIDKDVLFYDESGGGVTFSGGEPLGQPRFLEALLDGCNRREIHAALDTSGFGPPKVLERLLPGLQLVLFDLKIMDDRQHRHYTGVSNRTILANLKRVANSDAALRIRIPLIPGITDGDGNLARIIDFIHGLAAVEAVDLLPYHRIGESKYARLGRTDPMAGTAPLSPRRVQAISERFSSAGFTVTIGGQS